jgi:hypothetical protein
LNSPIDDSKPETVLLSQIARTIIDINHDKLMSLATIATVKQGELR